MLQTGISQRQVCENAAARYRALLLKTRDPNRRRMLEEMIARELAGAPVFEAAGPAFTNQI